MNDSDSIRYIYGLTDPRNGAVRYIGTSASPKIRQSDAIQRASNGQIENSKDRWVATLLVNKLRPQLVIYLTPAITG